MSSGALDVVATAIPGIRDILVLGKVKSLERQDVADLILVDAPATGHAMTFLSSAQGLLDAARSGPVRTQAADVVELLSDADRCQVALVTLPEEMPVNEVVEAAYALEDRIGISLGPVIVNACLPADPRLERDVAEAASEVGVTLSEDQAGALEAAAVFRSHRFRLQEEQRARLAAELPLPQLQAPFLFSAGIGPDELELLAAELAEAVRRLPEGDGRSPLGPTRPAVRRGRRGRRRGRAMTSVPERLAPSATIGLSELVAERAIVVCCGSGGVGKTTVSAAFALEAARRGRRACVVTIDPAKRLADALGIDTLANTPSRIDGDWPGELWALMLDPKGTFDELIARYASTPEQAEGILSNRIYRNLTGALSGTQEYMAIEKLYELSEEGRYDLVVVDTPPTRNALDFLDAPRRLTRFLGHRLFQLLLMPTRAYLRAVSVATQALLRTISKVAGAEIVHDAVAFFQAFEGMEEGFRTRADHMRKLLARRTTAFVLVTSPAFGHRGGGGVVRRQAQRVGAGGGGPRRQSGPPRLRLRRAPPGGSSGKCPRSARRQPPWISGREPTRGGCLRRPRHPGGPLAGLAWSPCSTWTCTTSTGSASSPTTSFGSGSVPVVRRPLRRSGRHPLA